jgi:hypothetical protein
VASLSLTQQHKQKKMFCCVTNLSITLRTVLPSVIVLNVVAPMALAVLKYN